MILDGSSPDAIAQAARRLAEGALVAFPTETVYGLGADAGSDAAVAGIFAAKGRPSDHPLIVHVTGEDMARRFAREVPPVAHRLMQAFWPGPLTVILPRREGMGQAAAGGQDSIGLRCPSHPVARALLAACAQLAPPVAGLAAPSANRFGRVSPTTAAHVRSEFGDDLLVLDGGACEVGIESSIVDCTRGKPVLLRPGTLTHAQIEAACGERLWLPHEVAQAAPRASGTLASHYAPHAQVRLMDAKALQDGLDLLGADAAHLAIWSRTPLAAASRGVTLRRMPDDAARAARELFAVLREFDAQGARLIWIEQPPEAPEWAGVRDRLRRAAA
ncbi:L-threonylcarbamoyladenylate synthase [Ramlibacter sp. MAHUQ-53]|uniref:L-threonylcarbamoyladenylate synthase n=1 Tax=unclassified Ramlibacter TaxID=2617605 RepID=UPI00362C60F4